MFSKKPVSTLPAWAVRVLTPEMVVDGYTDAEAHPEIWPFFTPHTGSAPNGMLWLDEPRFAHLTPGSAPAPAPAGQWLLPYGSTYAAVLPLDAVGVAAVRKNANGYRYPFAAVLNVGPFIIRGQLMTEYEGRPSLATLSLKLSLVVQEAEIECRVPMPQLPAFKAPIVLVRTLLLQGMVVLA